MQTLDPRTHEDEIRAAMERIRGATTSEYGFQKTETQEWEGSEPVRLARFVMRVEALLLDIMRDVARVHEVELWLSESDGGKGTGLRSGNPKALRGG